MGRGRQEGGRNSCLEHMLRIKPNNIITVFFFIFSKILFNYGIQEKFITRLMNSTLNCTRKLISYSSLRDLCDNGFRMQYNAEFPRQVMNFSIELHKLLNKILHSDWLRKRGI